MSFSRTSKRRKRDETWASYDRLDKPGDSSRLSLERVASIARNYGPAEHTLSRRQYPIIHSARLKGPFEFNPWFVKRRSRKHARDLPHDEETRGEKVKEDSTVVEPGKASRSKQSTACQQLQSIEGLAGTRILLEENRTTRPPVLSFFPPGTSDIAPLKIHRNQDTILVGGSQAGRRTPEIDTTATNRSAESTQKHRPASLAHTSSAKFNNDADIGARPGRQRSSSRNAESPHADLLHTHSSALHPRSSKPGESPPGSLQKKKKQQLHSIAPSEQRPGPLSPRALSHAHLPVDSYHAVQLPFGEDPSEQTGSVNRSGTPELKDDNGSSQENLLEPRGSTAMADCTALLLPPENDIFSPEDSPLPDLPVRNLTEQLLRVAEFTTTPDLPGDVALLDAPDKDYSLLGDSPLPELPIPSLSNKATVSSTTKAKEESAVATAKQVDLVPIKAISFYSQKEPKPIGRIDVPNRLRAPLPAQTTKRGRGRPKKSTIPVVAKSTKAGRVKRKVVAKQLGHDSEPLEAEKTPADDADPGKAHAPGPVEAPRLDVQNDDPSDSESTSRPEIFTPVESLTMTALPLLANIASDGTTTKRKKGSRLSELTKALGSTPLSQSETTANTSLPGSSDRADAETIHGHVPEATLLSADEDVIAQFLDRDVFSVEKALEELGEPSNLKVAPVESVA